MMTLHVLIVDDNPINLKLALEVLAAAHFRVDVAVDAEQARAMLNGPLPELILMDLALPGMDGLTLTRLLKADDRLARVPVVAVTAYAMKGDAEKAFAAGCDAYISKPIDTRNFARQLLNIVRASERGTRETLS
jgi:CheY-like chemotaxis protein